MLNLKGNSVLIALRRYQNFASVVVRFAMVEQDVCQVRGGDASVIVPRLNLDLG
jgi:hypothetical protein